MCVCVLRNGQSLGTAFTNIKMGPGVAYFPAISLSFKESVAFNFGSRPLRYPSVSHTCTHTHTHTHTHSSQSQDETERIMLI